MDEVTDPACQENLEQLILGTWDWKYTDLIFEGINPPDDRVTPESTGHTRQRRFMENGCFEDYADGQITGTHLYAIEIDREATYEAGTVRVFRLCTDGRRVEFGLTDDTFEMWPMGAGVCGTHSVYARGLTTLASDA